MIPPDYIASEIAQRSRRAERSAAVQRLVDDARRARESDAPSLPHRIRRRWTRVRRSADVARRPA